MGFDNSFWGDVRETRERLESSHPDGVVWLKINRGNVPTCVSCSPATAAPCLVNGTHREASQTDLEAHRLYMDIVNRRSAARLHKRGRHDIALIRR